jgi:ubiquinone/menaquinone biosynthesis C-methylase UbiE
VIKNRIEKESRFWNSFSAKYDGFINRTLGKTYQQLYQMLKTDISGSGKILEVATGTGLLAFEICIDVDTIKAIDIAPEMIRIACEKQSQRNISNIDFEVGDSCNLAFKDGTFDVVIASNVLHLLFDPAKSLSEINRVLKTDGKAILPTFCHAENVQSRIISGFMSLFGFRARNKWSAKSFASFVESNEFEILKSEIIPGKIPLMYCVTRKKGLTL